MMWLIASAPLWIFGLICLVFGLSGLEKTFDRDPWPHYLSFTRTQSLIYSSGFIGAAAIFFTIAAKVAS